MAAPALNFWAAGNQARRRYEAAGYEVTASERLEPDAGPEPGTGLVAYLVARRGGGDAAETHIIELAPSDGDDGSAARLAALQGFVDGRTGWHLDIVRYERPSDACPPSHGVVAEWIAEARRLAPISLTGAVALARHAVSGALFRLEVARGERYREPPDLSHSLIRGLETDGAISAEEAETLRSFHAAVSAPDASLDSGLSLEDLTEAALAIAERCSAEDADVVAEMLAWFERHFCTPEQAGIAADSATGDYVWLGMGPYDARAVLRTRFGESERASLDRAVFLIEQDGLKWARRDADGASPAALSTQAEVQPVEPDAVAGVGHIGPMMRAVPSKEGLGLVERHHLLQWADTVPVRTELPELIRDLIVETTPTPDLIRIDCPTAEGTVRRDFDLVVESRQGTAWVPAGRSGWEVSASASVARKANADYDARTGEERADASETTYIHVTPRSWPEARDAPPAGVGSAGSASAGASRQQAKRRWQQQRSEAGHWREVRALDVDDLLNWLIQAPATRARLSERLGLVPDGFTSARGRWETELAQTGGRLGAEVLLAGRERRFRELVERCSTGGGIVYVAADSTPEAIDFVLAAGARDETPGKALLDQMLLVSDAAAWRRLKCEPGGGAILVASELDVADGAESSRHCTVVPLARATRPSTGTGEHEVLIEVGPIDPTAAADALERQGLDRSEAWRLATLGRRSLGALRRALRLGPQPIAPAWLDQLPDDRGRPAVWAALLAGRWSESHESDQTLLCQLAGDDLSYDELLLTLRPLSEGADPLIAQIGDQWDVVAPQESWLHLAPEIPVGFLDRFSSAAQRVLTETEVLRWPDGTPFEIKGCVQTRFSYSHSLRHGVARSAALLGTLGIDTRMASGMGATTRAALIVRCLLGSDDADERESDREREHSGPASDSTQDAVAHTLRRIVELARVLHLLAEAAPDEFLDATIPALDAAQGNPDCLRALSDAKAGPSSDAGWYGLRRAFETLAWSPEPSHLPLIAESLLTITAFGHDELADKAHGCLVSLFLPPLPQTGLSTEARNAVLAGLCDRIRSGRALGAGEHRAALWGCLWDLAPHGSGAAPNATPEVRAWPAVAEPPALEDRAPATDQVIARLLDMVACFASNASESEHLIDMFWPLDEGGRFMRLPPESRSEVLAVVEETAGRGDLDRSLLSDRLWSFIRLHRQFPNAFWTLEPDELARVEQAADRIGDDDPATAGAWLFESLWPELGADDLGDEPSAEDALVAERRREAAARAFADDGLTGVRRLAERAHHNSQNFPWQDAASLSSPVPFVGRALAEAALAGDLSWTDTETALLDHLDATLGVWLAEAQPLAASDDTRHGETADGPGPESDVGPQHLAAHGYFAHRIASLLDDGANPTAWLAGLKAAHRIGSDSLARLLNTLHVFPITWDIAAALGPSVEESYWSQFNPRFHPVDERLAVLMAQRLLRAGRSGAAVEALAASRRQISDEVAPHVVDIAVQALESYVDDEAERQGRRFKTGVRELLDWLSTQPLITEGGLDDPLRMRLERLQLALEDRPGRLGDRLLMHERLVLRPAFFVGLLRSMFSNPQDPTDGEFDAHGHPDGADAVPQIARDKAWALLHYWKRIPGDRGDGHIEIDRLRSWVLDALQGLGRSGLLPIGSQYIGRMLAKAPADPADDAGTVLPPPIRDLLEELHRADVERGLVLGILDQRGVHSRGVMDGGKAERALHRRYSDQAQTIGSRWPRAAQVLRHVAASYDSRGRENDVWSEQFARGS